MLDLQEVGRDRALVNEIDWEMTPEKAVSLYLEWGNGWNHGVRMVKSPDDVALYFVVYYWDDKPVLHLVRRDTAGAEEMAAIPLPDDLARRFADHWGGHKGVYALTDEISAWLKAQLGVADLYH